MTIVEAVKKVISSSDSGLTSREVYQQMLATKQYCGVSNGSACTSSSYSHSHVLSAMHLSDDRIESAIRISWGGDINPYQFFGDFTSFLQVARDL